MKNNHKKYYIVSLNFPYFSRIYSNFPLEFYLMKKNDRSENSTRNYTIFKKLQNILIFFYEQSLLH